MSIKSPNVIRNFWNLIMCSQNSIKFPTFVRTFQISMTSNEFPYCHGHCDGVAMSMPWPCEGTAIPIPWQRCCCYPRLTWHRAWTTWDTADTPDVPQQCQSNARGSVEILYTCSSVSWHIGVLIAILSKSAMYIGMQQSCHIATLCMTSTFTERFASANKSKKRDAALQQRGYALTHGKFGNP